jgi:hypothetical protein
MLLCVCADVIVRVCRCYCARVQMLLCACADVGAGEHGRQHCDRDPAGVRHLGQEALTLPHQVRLQSQTLPKGSNQRFI